MVGGDAPQQGFGMAALAHGLGGGRHKQVQSGLNAGLLGGRHQRGPAQLLDPLVAAAATEDEIDGRQHVALGHLGHHKAQGRRLRLGRLGYFGALAATALGGPPHLAVGMETRALVVEQGVQALGAAEAEGQGHGPVVAVHQRGGAMHPIDPVGELAGIGHRGRERHQLNRGRTVDDRFFPHGAALGIIHVVALVEHHRLHALQRVISRIGFRVEHVAEDLGGHHHHLGLPVEAHITGEQPHPLGAKLLAEIAQLLVGERLQRRGVKNLLAMGQGPVDGVFAHQGLARTSGRTHHNRMALLEGVDRLQLEII